MRHLRAWARIMALAVFTAGMYVVFLATRPAGLASAARGLRLQSWCFRRWARGATLLIGMRIRCAGTPPRPPCFLVCNHLSYVDVILLAARSRCFFVAKAEVARWPVIGLLARSMNVIFVDRKRRGDLPRVLVAMRRAMDAGQGIVFFPEGTSSAGERVLPFKASLFEAPVLAGQPVYSAALAYRAPAGEPPAGESVCWWGDMTFGAHLYTMLGLPGFEAALAFGDRMSGADRKALASAAHAAVSRLFGTLFEASHADVG